MCDAAGGGASAAAYTGSIDAARRRCSGHQHRTASEQRIPRYRPTDPQPPADDSPPARRAPGRRDTPHNTTPAEERAYLVGIDSGRRAGEFSATESLRELGQLATTAGARVVGATLQRRPHPDPATYIGSGKIEEIQAARAETGYTLVVFDDQLSPSQQLNLEKAFGVKVLDRSALILDIFASRARTREASLQVELAQLEYLLPRLRGQWQHLERTEGAVGLRGPGETQLETDRRLIGRRISHLKQQIAQVRAQRELQRSRRTRQQMPVVALVGYTNAGKSSLMRALAGADVLAMDAVFATLDPVTRRVGSASGEAFLLTDTVGFMQKLPTQLISAFRATLEELKTADLLLHVVDSTARTLTSQVRTVLRTLEELDLADVPLLTVVNKVDGLTFVDAEGVERPVERPEDLAILAAERRFEVEGEVMYTAATTGLGVEALRRRLLWEFYGRDAAEAARSRAAAAHVDPLAAPQTA